MDEILSLPKADVHLHLQSMLDVNTLFDIAQRTNLSTSLSKTEFELKLQNFSCLNDLFDLLEVIEAIPTSYIDLYHALMPYYARLNSQNVNYIEPSIYFGSFNLHPSEVLKGILQAASEAEGLYGIKTGLIYLFGRGESEKKMKENLSVLQQDKECFVGINAAGNEMKMTAKQIKPVYEYAKNLGFCKDGNATIHTGEEAPVEQIISSLYHLDLKRIDHGIRAHEDPYLLKFLGDCNFSLAMCPVSNKKLKVCERFCSGKYVYDQFIRSGCKISINSDDPYLINSFLNDVYLDFYNYYEDRLPNGMRTYVDLIKNAYSMSFLSDYSKANYLNSLNHQLNKLNLF